MKPNYKNELNAALVKKHRVIQESKRVAKELKEITETSAALAVLAGDPYNVNQIHNKIANLKMEIDTNISFEFEGTGPIRWKLFANIEAVEALMKKHHAYSEQDLETYAGILIDLVEWSNYMDSRIPEWLFFLRVYCNDDIENFIGFLKEEFGKK